jgi:lipoprotein signal peptidase
MFGYITEGVNHVVDDLLKRISFPSSQIFDGESVVNINDLFFKFAMEANQGASYVQKKSQPFSLRVLLTLHLLCSLLLFSLSSFLLLSSPPFCLWKEVTVIAKLDVGDIALG